MKKRYFYACALSIVLFIITFVLFDFPIYISSPLAIITYVAGIFIFKEKDIRNYNPNDIMHYAYLISKIDNYINIVKDETVDKNIKDISRKSEKILAMLEQKPAKVTQVYEAFDFYLPFAVEMIEHYISLEGEEKLSPKDKKYMDEINDKLDYLEAAIDKLLENMNYTKTLDINASIEVLKKETGGKKHKEEDSGKESDKDA